jgi:septum formation protein
LPFTTHSPAIDEEPRSNEPPEQLVRRLAREKADEVARRFPDAVVIGSDQIALCAGRILGKPGTPDRARHQLRAFSGQTVSFLSALAVRCGADDFLDERTVATEARFRHLTEDEIRRYVERDQPADCAGGFKSEETGITLLEALISEDPTAIIGLPLIALSHALRQAGFEVP